TALGQELLVGGVTSTGYQQKAWSPATNGWIPKGKVVPGGVTTRTAFAGSADCQAVDVAVNFNDQFHGGEFSCYAYEAAQGGGDFSVVDDNNGQNVMPDTQMDSNGYDPRVVSV